ncbi:hypothetical protein PR001_g30135, partial [Phytophthora rubi]
MCFIFAVTRVTARPLKCSDYTFSDQGSSSGQSSECATFNAPLFYPGICKAPQFADPTIDVFVKRMPATTGDPKTATNVWLLQGGPGYSSTAMESSMISLFAQLNGSANVYTMDYRGTGRSTLLECVAAQATTSGSPEGRELDPSEVPACAQDLENEYGNLASFSVTKVTGYVLDGIATTSGSSADKFPYMSKRDIDFRIVGDRFLELCSQDVICSSRFKKPNTLPKTLRGLLAEFDKDPNSTCATLLKDVKIFGQFLPSAALSLTLGRMLMDAELRKLIPPLVYRLNRCDAKDADVLSQFIYYINAYIGASTQDDAFFSPLLFYLITYSEIYERPLPSKTEMERRFKSALVSAGAFAEPPQYCAFTKEKSKAC